MWKQLWIFVFLVSHGFLAAQGGWSLKKDREGIKIYTRMVPNSSFKEFKATTYIASSIGPILEELIKAPNYTEDCEADESFYVGKRGENQYVFYARKELPWPLKDRDIVTLLTVEKISAKKIKLHIESLPEGIPEKNKTIRIKELMGLWTLEQLDGKTKVTQQLHLNPEGSLPAIVINSLLIKGPFKTFTELRSSTQKN